MCETPKDDNEETKDAGKKSHDRSYYYDDAHGYKDFDPDVEEPEADEEDSA